jgi:hypothetical protein
VTDAVRTSGIAEQKGQRYHAEFIYICRWPTGAEPSADEIGFVDQGLTGSFGPPVFVNGIEQVEPETLGRVWVESEGLTGLTLAWTTKVYVVDDTAI